MTLQQQLDTLTFLLDDKTAWFNERERMTALQKGAVEWVLDRYREADRSEAARADLAFLTPKPIAGRGSEVSLSSQEGVWRLLTVAVNTSLGWRQANPLMIAQATWAESSLLCSPDEESPAYKEAGSADGSRVITLLPGGWAYRIQYLRYLSPIILADKTSFWESDSPTIQQQWLDRAVRILQQQRAQDYMAQARVEVTSPNP